MHAELTWCSQGLIKDISRESHSSAAVTSKEMTHSTATVNSQDNQLCFFISILFLLHPVALKLHSWNRPQTLKFLIIVTVYWSGFSILFYVASRKVRKTMWVKNDGNDAQMLFLKMVYIYSSTVFKYNFEILVLYLSILIFYYFTLTFYTTLTLHFGV